MQISCAVNAHYQTLAIYMANSDESVCMAGRLGPARTSASGAGCRRPTL